MLRRFTSRLCAAAVPSGVGSASSLPSAHLSQEQLDGLSPRDMVGILDRFIVGQADAKKAVAISLRNRWRRRQLTDLGLQGDIMPKNILMIGPTGVGKTEISRRMARITDAPFVKVEATKYTEVGFKGKDVESMIEDLFANAKTKTRRKLERDRDDEATRAAQDVIFTAYVRQRAMARSAAGPSEDAENDADAATDAGEASKGTQTASSEKLTFEEFQKLLASGSLDAELVTIDITVTPPDKKKNSGTVEIFLFGGGPSKVIQQVRKPIAEALPLAKREVLNKLIDDTQVANAAKTLCEQEGIIFVDEIDKVVSEASAAASDVSALGVQQDLLPLIEGSTVTLKDGTTIETDCILFICSGAFHVVKPADMIAELQGRLPVRVELQALTEKDFRRILTEPKFNLLAQQSAMMAAEKIELEFSEAGINAIARVAQAVNAQAQNIGARRLHTIIEAVVDDISFDCEVYEGKKVVVDEKLVKSKTDSMIANVDLSRYII